VPKKKTKRKKPVAAGRPRSGDQVGTLTVSPARSWQQAKDLGAPPPALTILEKWPFVLNAGATITMQRLALETGHTLPQTVDELLALEDIGALRWDGPRNTYWQTTPSRAV
jgi:hypothetical protein